MEIWSITSIKTATPIESTKISGQADVHNIGEADDVLTASPMEVSAIGLNHFAAWKEIFPVPHVPLRSGNWLEVVRQTCRTLSTDDVH